MINGDKKYGTMCRRRLLKYTGMGLLVPLAGCSSEDPEDGNGGDGGNGDGGNSVTVTMGAHTGTLDPQDFTGSPARSIIFNSYEKLITLDFLGDGSPIPQLASGWDRLEDQLLRVNIREGVSWHNGDTFTPEDAAYSINRVSDPDVGMTTRREALNVDVAEVVDGEHAIDIHLTAPDPIIVQRLGYAGGVINKAWVEENGQEIGQIENGTGPYRLAEFEPDTIARFERLSNDEYWNGDVDLNVFPEELTYRASSEPSTRVSQMLAEESHIINGLPPEDVGRIEDAGHAGVRDVRTDRTMMLMMRYDVEPFSSLQFRQALNHAVDPETLIETVLGGYGAPTNQITPDTWFGHNPDLEENPPYPYDPDLAEQLIDESGYMDEEITIAVPQGRYMKDSEVGTAIAGQLDSLSNLSADVDIQPWSNHRERIAPELENAPPIHFFGFGSAPPDASIKIDRNFTTDALNSDFSIFSDDDIDAISEQAENTVDTDEREQILQEANRIVVEDKAACVPLYFQSALFGTNTDVVDFTPIPQEEIYWFSMELK